MQIENECFDYEITCPVCGEKMMLCTLCMWDQEGTGEDAPGDCDWTEEYGCFRKKPTPKISKPCTDRICFIDGHDLKYKTFTCEAQNQQEAISKMMDLFGANFDHHIEDVFKVEE